MGLIVDRVPSGVFFIKPIVVENTIITTTTNKCDWEGLNLFKIII